MSRAVAPQTVEEAWDLFNARRFTHGHRESQKESFAEAMKGVFDKAEEQSEAKGALPVVGYLIEHDKEGRDFQWVPLTKSDLASGYRQTPLVRGGNEEIQETAR